MNSGMLFALLCALGQPPLQDTIAFREGLSIGGVAVAGRSPVPLDTVLAKIIRGEAVRPNAGDTMATPRGTTVIWKGAKANEQGAFEVPGGGYLYVTQDMPADRTMLLEAKGDTAVYVNGELRPGDPYGTGYLRLPVALHQGTNEFLFVSAGRGGLEAKLLEPSGPLQLDTGDLTLPDSIPGDTGNLFGGIVVLNSTTEDATDLTIACAADGKDVVTSLPRVPAMSLRKVRFDFPAGVKDLDLILLKAGKPIHSAKASIRQRATGETYKRTFESSIDGSVQYYAVNPSLKPDKSDALILTLHGAGVEAIGQADAYAPKDWATIVAPTNRRPYGFDWEDWGRLDGMEVLDVAGAAIPHDSKHVVVTGHSMGGHGTWSLGTMFPDRFGATAPSAGWISFWSYAGGWDPKDPTPAEAMLRRAMSPSDTLARVTNLGAEKVYILHGDADDNVPVTQARTMSKTLSALNYEFGYHEEPGAGHWWGNRCVDYPDLMLTLASARISNFKTVDFTTPDPAISGSCGWVEILQQIHPRLESHLVGDQGSLTTENVRALRFSTAPTTIKIDGQTIVDLYNGATVVRVGDRWLVQDLRPTERTAELSGPIKSAFNERFVLVYGTAGNADENRWSRDKARFDAESFYYRGNGAPEVLSDRDYLHRDFRGRNAIVYGNADTNLAWNRLLGKALVRVHRGVLHVGEHGLTGDGAAALFVFPSEGRLIGAIGGTGLAGMRLTDRIPVLGSGTAYPDWVVLGPKAADLGTKGIVGAGFFGHDWSLSSGDGAWASE